MSDIVERLRQGSLTRDDYRWKAADEITRLTAEIEKLNEAMEMLLTDVRRTDHDMRDLKVENEKLRKELDEAQREITQLYEDAAGESI